MKIAKHMVYLFVICSNLLSTKWHIMQSIISMQSRLMLGVTGGVIYHNQMFLDEPVIFVRNYGIMVITQNSTLISNGVPNPNPDPYSYIYIIN